jgi:hypothetical protein
VGDPDGAVAGHEQAGVAGAVALEGGAVAVEFPAVELDDELGGWPEDVDLPAEDDDVGAVRRQVVGGGELLEPLLERRARSRSDAGFSEKAPNWLQRVASEAALANSLDLAESQPFEPIGLLPGALDSLEVNCFGVVEESAGEGGDRDAVTGGHFVEVEASAMKPDSTPPPPPLIPTRGGDIDEGSRRREFPESRRAGVTQRRAVPAGEYGG